MSFQELCQVISEGMEPAESKVRLDFVVHRDKLVIAHVLPRTLIHLVCNDWL